MKLYAARHGETTWNVEKRLMGQQPGELSARGIEQARQLAEEVAKITVDGVFASDLGRVRQTVAIVQERMPGLRVAYEPALRERGFGELEGKLYQDVDMGIFESLGVNESQFGIETVQAMTDRIARLCAKLYEQSEGKNIAFFCHTGVMNRLRYLSDPQAYAYSDYPHASVVEFDFDAIYRAVRTLRA
jgi:broad specificity phosphatase PhoE